MLQRPKLNAHCEPGVVGEGPGHWDSGWPCVCSHAGGGDGREVPGGFFTGTWMGALKDRGLVILEGQFCSPCQGVLMPMRGVSILKEFPDSHVWPPAHLTLQALRVWTSEAPGPCPAVPSSHLRDWAHVEGLSFFFRKWELYTFYLLSRYICALKILAHFNGSHR